jgi:hypothetical protein
MKRRYKILLGGAGTLVLLGVAGYITYGGGQHEGPGVVHGSRVPLALITDRATRQRAIAAAGDKQILFGDLHVHTTFSVDAFLFSLPFLGGTGTNPPAEACDFARYCSALDFFALTDHAEGLTPRHWRETKESVRQCNAVAGDPADPDLVAFTGWEWSHVGQVPDEHYGHKNVIFRDTGEDQLPTRPIGAGGLAGNAFKADPGLSMWTLLTIPIRDFSRRQRYLDLATLTSEIKAVGNCPDGVPSRELPVDCRELAATPASLFEKLDSWGFDALVIPHGSTWGFYTPPNYAWDKQLAAAQRSDTYQNLIEVYSGHGNSEEYRPWRAAHGTPEDFSCPAPSEGYEPCCWRAGEIIRGRCKDPSSAECEQRTNQARHDYVAAGAAGRLSIPDASAEEWRGCGQCRDCFAPAFTYRPGGSAQYILARGNFDDPAAPQHERFGFIASSDNHTARPGTGYKEIGRRGMADVTGPESQAWSDRLLGARPAQRDQSTAYERADLLAKPPFRLLDLERQASFFMTGGLVAVHSEGRNREAIWAALKRQEVYGTSGPRLLLWFDLLNGPDGAVPMGGEVALSQAPRFEVRAAGSFVQQPGCPDYGDQGPSADYLGDICMGECYNPGDRRYRIARIDIIRIRPQQRDDEELAPLIQDAWKSFTCPAEQAICRFEFDDPEFVTGARDVLYYARAIQEPTPGINTANERCKDAACGEPEPCYGDFRSTASDDCLSPTEERAWSSPIFVDFTAAPADAGVAP